MTFINQAQVMPDRPAPLREAVKLFNWWRECQRLRRDHKRLPELPAHLMRDVGLERLIEHDPETWIPHRLL